MTYQQQCAHGTNCLFTYGFLSVDNRLTFYPLKLTIHSSCRLCDVLLTGPSYNRSRTGVLTMDVILFHGCKASGSRIACFVRHSNRSEGRSLCAQHSGFITSTVPATELDTHRTCSTVATPLFCSMLPSSPNFSGRLFIQ